MKIIWVKCSPRLCSPPRPPHEAEVWGAESLQSPPSPVYPHEGASMYSYSNFFILEAKKPHLLPCGSISSTLKRRGLALVPSLFRSSVVVNLHVSCPNSTSVLSSSYSWQILTWNCLQLEYSDNGWFKAGLHAKAVLTSLNTTFLPISRSRFKQR